MDQRAPDRFWRRHAVLPALLVVASISLVAAGCGGDDDDEESAATEATTEETTAGGGGGQTIDVSETEYKLDPADPTVKSGTVTIKATNDGHTTHSIEVEGPGEESELEQDLQPGQSGELQVDLSEPGTYEWYCPVANHKDLGMEGEITVQG